MLKNEKKELESKIIQLELEITKAIMNGHKAKYDDIFQEKRKELDILRCTVFGTKSNFCKKLFFGDE